MSKKCEIIQQLQDGFEGADYPVTSPMDLVPALVEWTINDVRVRDDYVERNTFILADGELKIVVDVDNINPDGHADEVLTTVRELTA
jgi:hypothetical protein